MRAKRSFLFAALLALIPVIPGAIANSAITSEWLGVLDDNAPANSINLTHAGVAMLLAPGHILQTPIQLVLFKVGYGHHFWFWLNVGKAIVSWLFYFGVFLLFLLWRAGRKETLKSAVPQGTSPRAA